MIEIRITMLIGLFEDSERGLYQLMNTLSKELDFGLILLRSLDDCKTMNLDGLVVDNQFEDTKIVAALLKQFKNLLLLDPGNAYNLVNDELLIISEEAGVELLVAGPDHGSALFGFIKKYASDPFYVRVAFEEEEMAPLSFERMYKSLYWNAFFSDGEIRRIKVNAQPAVTSDGVIFYGKTESAKSIPVDTWFSNVGFERSEVVKVYSQNSVIVLDCATQTFKMKNAEVEVVDSYKDQAGSKEPFIRSFVEQLKGNEHRMLNVTASNFIKVKQLYHLAQQHVLL